MATYAEELEHEGRVERQRNKRVFFKALAIAAVLTLTPMAASVVLMMVKQEIPQRSVVAISPQCSSYTQLAKKEGAPSPTYLLRGKYCEIQNYDSFKSDATSYNQKRALPVALITMILMIGLIWKIVRAKF